MLQEMVLSDENSSRVGVKNTNIPGGEEIAVKNAGAEIRSKRRALGSIINHDLVGTSQCNCVVKKRGVLKGTNVVSCKNKPFPLQRPITRPNSAHMVAALPQSCAEETKKLTKSSNEFRVWEDAPATYVVEEQSETENQPQPMLVEHPEIEMTEKTQMEEVEMEDIFEESIMDIDSSDAKNPLAATDYVEDMYFYFKKVESSSCVFPNYMTNQEDINERMRSILIDWLIEVHHKFELREETLFLTVNLIDRFLERQSVVRKKLQLVGLVAMLLACKYEEVSVPVVDDLVFISDKAYKRTEILEMESLMLNTLQFNMSVPTPYVFMQRFLKAAQADRKLELVSFFFIELCLVEYEMLKYTPSFLAAAAIYTAQCTLYGGVGLWNKTCEWHSSYSEDQLLECSKMIVSFHQKAATGKLTGVYRKYNTSKFGYTARCEPAHHRLVQTTTSQ